MAATLLARARMRLGVKKRKLCGMQSRAYLGKTDPTAVKGAIADLQDRVTMLEQKLTGLGRLVRE